MHQDKFEIFSVSPRFNSHLKLCNWNCVCNPIWLEWIRREKYLKWAAMRWDENHSTLTCINWIVIADFPTPPPPTTTILYVWVWLDGPDDWLYRDIFKFFRSFHGKLTFSLVLYLSWSGSFSLSHKFQPKFTNSTQFLFDTSTSLPHQQKHFSLNGFGL